MHLDKSIEEKVRWFLEQRDPDMGSTLGMSFIKISKNELIADMPVNSKTVQPFRVLHGGASVALAETLCSVGAWVNIADDKTAVGIEINANHHRSVPEGGKVTATSKPIQMGKTIQVWETRIVDERGKLVCTSRCTLAIIDKR